ncbi:hypothetical protein [Rhizobium rhizogenes]|uniref:hypothetical protein n=1 Tax=Rhizobium rhizogenes TaxID=359 RepID=UPI00226F6F12|nr:hypothetical protein [Rhizobium rhizogenes]
MRRFLLSAVAIFGFAFAAHAVTLWSPTTGDVNFPGLTPGAINNTPIGATTQSTGGFSVLTVDTGTKTATATAGAATLNKGSGIVTSEALTTAAGATYTLTITDSTIVASDLVFASVQLGSATTGTPVITTTAVSANTITIVVQNVHASAALNGTIKVSFVSLAL